MLGGGSFWEGAETGAFMGAIGGIIAGGLGSAMAVGGGISGLSVGQVMYIGGMVGAGSSLFSDFGDILIKGEDISFGQVLLNMGISGALGAAFAGIGYGLSKAFAALKLKFFKSNVADGAGKSYNPINKGPLPDKVANTFRSGTYTEIVSQGDVTLFRVYGGKAQKLGSYWTSTKPKGPVQSIIDNALDQNWGNTATKVTTIKVPPGTTIYKGYAASQGNLVGGGTQVYIPEVKPSWIVK